ncbi:hypothetical protein ASPCAL07688 [Aspergillus calidoustus]|uniref:F-box domain-containing protein n=1 Tax=Aspergillus calidoustus TaxID=454130 RepID=A0A0U5GQ66_ASPCI|nr:hypothetical protein ASPCAL07688 [Aspergillus calidoustus]
MDRLPHELVQQIADVIRGPPRPHKHQEYCSCRECRAPIKLASYTTISQTWQAVVERIIWQDIRLGWDKYNSLAQLKEYTSASSSGDIDASSGSHDSGRDSYRRDRIRYIRTLTWTYDPDRSPLRITKEELPEGYNMQFHASLTELFAVLHSWEDTKAGTEMQLSLRVGNTEFIDLPDEVQWALEPSVADLATLDVGQLWHRAKIPHQLHLPPALVDELPVLAYITTFGLHEPDRSDVTPSVFMGLLTRFPHARRVYGGEGHAIPRGAWKALVEQRQEIMDNLPSVPSSVETFKYMIDHAREMSHNPGHNAANYLSPQGFDELSIGFRTLSMRLRKLRLKYVRISSALFWPEENENVDTAGQYWPRLEELLIQEVPPYTADGQWMLENNPEKWYNNSDVSLEDDPDQDWEYDFGDYGPRQDIKRHEAQKMYVAMGRAAQRMPKLRRLDFTFRAEVGEGGPNDLLRLEREPKTGKAELQILSNSGFVVGDEVLDAWKVREAGEGTVQEMMRRHGRVAFEKWPPA